MKRDCLDILFDELDLDNEVAVSNKQFEVKPFTIHEPEETEINHNNSIVIRTNEFADDLDRLLKYYDDMLYAYENDHPNSDKLDRKFQIAYKVMCNKYGK